MHTIEILQEALRLLQQCGYTIREEWLEGGGGGACRFRGAKWFFMDLALAPDEQLDAAVAALRDEAEVIGVPMPQPLRELLGLRRCA